MFDYPVILAPDDGTVLVTFPDVPEAITFGADTDEALLQAVDALESALSFYVDDRKPLPTPSKPKRGQHTVRPSALECAKLGVYRAMTEQGIKKAELRKVFEPFVRGSDRTKKDGFGLGLTLVNKVMAAMGGRVWAEIPPDGTGTMMCLELPEATTP